jgi:hypothetical protein
MLTIIWLFIKSAFSAAWSLFLKILPFIIKFWREILICLLVVLWQGEKASHRATAHKFEVFKADIQKESDKRKAEIKLNSILAQKKTDANAKAHQEALSSLNIDREKLKKELKRDQNDIMRLLATINRMRDTEETAGLSTIPLSTDLLAEASPSNAIVTIAGTCTETTLDYNELMKAWLDYCNIYGCKQLELGVIK